MAYQPYLRAPIAATGAGDKTLIAAPLGSERIRVIAVVISASATVSIIFKSGANPLTGAVRLPVNTPLVLPQGPDGASWFDCGLAQPLVLNVGAAANVDGWVVYSVQ